MIRGFVTGKYYIYKGPPEVGEDWNQRMSFVFEDRKPYLCVNGGGCIASFEVSGEESRPWDWSDGFEYWEEVKNPEPPKENIIGTTMIFPSKKEW